MKFFIPKALLAILILMVCFFYTYAQNAGHAVKIAGSLTDDHHQSVGYASVSLLRVNDSVLLKGTLSDENGNYFFDHIRPGTYVVTAVSVGYNKCFSQAIHAAEGADVIAVPPLKMQVNNHQLQTVNIIASRPLIEHKAGGVIVNVENSILAAGNSAMEILQRAPGVSIDNNDKISLQGKQDVKIMINDKLTYLSADQLATMLRSTDGNTIQSIEILTNPSARYDAAGNAGVINIKLKHNKQSGTNGTISVGGGMGRHFRDNMSIDLNHQKGNLNVFGTFSHADTHTFRDVILDRIITGQSNDLTYFDQHLQQQDVSHNNSYRLGADYETSRTNTLGIIVSGYDNNTKESTVNHTLIQSTRGLVDSSVVTNTAGPKNYRNLMFDLSDKFKIDTNGQELSGNLEYSKYKNNAFIQYNNQFFLPDGSAQHPEQVLTNQTPSKIDVRAAEINYTKPLGKTSKLDAGLKYSNVKSDNDLQARILSRGSFINDSTQSNHFIYTEKISAAYVNFNKQTTNTTVQVGLRTEYTQSKGDLIDLNTVNRHYLNFFPSVFINHSVNSKNSISLSYSRRIDRPEYDDLNPFVYYLDPFTFRLGNAFLQPQYTNKYEAGYSFNKTVNVSMGYSQTNNAMVYVVLTSGNKSFSTARNINSLKAYNFDFNSPYRMTSWWTGDIDFNGFYQKYSADTLAGNKVSQGKVAFQVKATESFLFADFKAELSGDYNSPTVQGVDNVRSYYGADAGISRSIAHEKLNVKLSVSDIFKTRSFGFDGRILSIYSYVQRYDSRITRLTVSYKFGNGKLKKRQHVTGAGDQDGRIKTS